MQNKLLIGLTVKLLKALCRNQSVRFHKSLERPKLAQQDVYWRLLPSIAKSEYGKTLGLIGDENYKEFAAKVPIQDYDQLEPWITQQLSQRASKVISTNRLMHSEPTSGSSGASKHIPYTRPLMNTFTNLFKIWALDLLTHGLNIETGKVFISVSPTERSNFPVMNTGFTTDRDFLREPLRSVLSPFVLTPPLTSDPVEFQQELALTLLSDDCLEIISIWSPTYLLSVIEYIEKNKMTLQQSVTLRKLPFSEDAPIEWDKVWPRLKLISCWDSAMAQTTASQLRRMFPKVHVQGKGLLATEAPITVPLCDAEGSLPLLNDIFFEFETEQGAVKRLHELEDRERYQIIITQPSGLTRYRLNDIIEVQGFHRSTPMLEFIGRANDVCDLAGEKLQEEFVCRTLCTTFPQSNFLLVPIAEPTLGYVLLLDPESLQDSEEDDLAKRADDALSQAHHYGLARVQSQLAPLRVEFVSNLAEQIQHFHQQDGKKLGNIKEVALLTSPQKAARLMSFIAQQTEKRTQPETSSLAQTGLPLSAGQPSLQFQIGA
jgi:hypothetical protein